MLITVVSAIVMVAVSMATAEPNYQSIQNLTFATKTDADRKETRASWTAADVLASAAVLLCITFAYLYFRG